MSGKKIVVAEESIHGSKYLCVAKPDVSIHHREVLLEDLRVQKNGHFQKDGKMAHEFRLRKEHGSFVADVTAVRFQEPYSYSLVKSLEGPHGRVAMFPEVHSFLTSIGRTKASDISKSLSEMAGLGVAVPFGAFGSVGMWGVNPVAPFIALDECSHGERYTVFFYPTRNGVKLDPNWIVLYVKNLRLPGAQPVQS